MELPRGSSAADRSKPGVSVVVCCYNSAGRLAKTLEHLARQDVPRDLAWEVVVVDNASTDDTSATASRTWRALGRPVPFRVVKQPVAGLAAARAMGTEVSEYAFIVFCDDDNWLAEDYVHVAFEALHGRPGAGVVGGRGTPALDGEPPKWFARYARSYALGAQGAASGDVSAEKGYVYGAGFVVRRSALDALRQRGFSSQLSGRKGASLASSEDRELCYALRLIGYEVHYVDALRFQHEIPARRLRWSYFLDMVEMSNRSTPVMTAYLSALRGEPRLAPDVARKVPRRRRAAIVFTALRRPRVLLAALRKNRVASGAVQWRRWRGAWTGWGTIGPRYDQLLAAVYALTRVPSDDGGPATS